VVIEAVAGATVTPIAGGGLGGGGLGAISLLSPPPQPAKLLTTSRTRAKRFLVFGLREPVISGCHPAVSVAAYVILELVVTLDRILEIAMAILEAGTPARFTHPWRRPVTGFIYRSQYVPGEAFSRFGSAHIESLPVPAHRARERRWVLSNYGELYREIGSAVNFADLMENQPPCVR
jgi:hypothetical protein